VQVQQQTIGLQPFGDQYLVANFVDGRPEGGRIAYVKIFSGVAVFILVDRMFELHESCNQRGQ